MAWIKLDDRFFRRPEVLEAGKDAAAVYLAGLCYCSAHRTDGSISTAALATIQDWAQIENAPEAAERLVVAGLWNRQESGYLIPNARRLMGSDPTLRTLWDRIRRRVAPGIFQRDGFTCRYCGGTDDLTCDHVRPLSRGGSNDPDNLVTACRACNTAKRDRLTSEWGVS